MPYLPQTILVSKSLNGNDWLVNEFLPEHKEHNVFGLAGKGLGVDGLHRLFGHSYLSWRRVAFRVIGWKELAIGIRRVIIKSEMVKVNEGQIEGHIPFDD